MRCFGEEAWPYYVQALQDENYWLSVGELVLLCHLAGVRIIVFKQTGAVLKAEASNLAGSGEVIFVKIKVDADARVRVRSHFERQLWKASVRNRSAPVLQWFASVAMVGCDLRGLPVLSRVLLLRSEQRHCMPPMRLALSRALCLRPAILQHQAAVQHRSSAIGRRPQAQRRQATPRCQHVQQQKQQWLLTAMRLRILYGKSAMPNRACRDAAAPRAVVRPTRSLRLKQHPTRTTTRASAM